MIPHFRCSLPAGSRAGAPDPPPHHRASFPCGWRTCGWSSRCRHPATRAAARRGRAPDRCRPCVRAHRPARCGGQPGCHAGICDSVPSGARYQPAGSDRTEWLARPVRPGLPGKRRGQRRQRILPTLRQPVTQRPVTQVCLWRRGMHPPVAVCPHPGNCARQPPAPPVSHSARPRQRCSWPRIRRPVRC